MPVCPQTQEIIDEFVPEFAKLPVVALMLPSGKPARVVRLAA